MRIGIDVRSLSKPKSGIGIYTLNLLKSLLELDRENQYYLYSCRDFEFEEYENVKIRKFPFPNGTLWIQLILPFLLLFDRINIFHSTETMLPLISNVPAIATVHDLISFLYPKGHDKKALLASKLFPFVFKRYGKLFNVCLQN